MLRGIRKEQGMQVRTRKFALGVAVVAAAISTLAIAPAANATPAPAAATQAVTADVAPPAVALDPSTFSGPLVIAVPSGHEVVVNVKAGDAPKVIADVQAADRAGKTQTLGKVMASMSGCGETVHSVAGPGTWWTSVQGCAVAGYNGYNRQYHWENGSDVELCTNGRGYNSSHAAAWYSTGCSGGDYSVPWGNVLAYTQMQGFSLSGVTGAAYLWRA